MKKTLLLFGLFLALNMGSYAQKYALIDMEYILKKIPAYENANKELEIISQQWQTEIDSLVKEADEMYKKYQADIETLQGNEKTKRENEIVAKENEIQKLRDKYFGPQGELFKRREAYMKPIQDDIYNAIKEISTASGYKVVIDRASATSIIFASPDIDISDQILARLGY
ncbi:OmpH family outer membrane protein [Anaerorudis cellulosivorans]|uniref:OmpH family outer membrane protein n=1 Tax=Anaerorudis cellulosivorans TaxID=3397862 RepID=UPI00221EEE8B|nr:OmpH family outer membrane protein [Seramator thermalis]MCW1734690.1 OmpH family outer membrane protein [Seramator thermalis]